jgi:hypothetical protein
LMRKWRVEKLDGEAAGQVRPVASLCCVAAWEVAGSRPSSPQSIICDASDVFYLNRICAATPFPPATLAAGLYGWGGCFVE